MTFLSFSLLKTVKYKENQNIKIGQIVHIALFLVYIAANEKTIILIKLILSPLHCAESAGVKESFTK